MKKSLKIKTSLPFILFFLNYTIVVSQTDNWSVSFGSQERESTVLAKTDNNGNIYTTGTHDDVIDFGSFIIPHVGLRDIFIEKRDKNGNLLWVKSFGSVKDEYVHAIAITDDGILISGIFEETLDVDPSSNVNNLISNGDYDIYLIKVDFDGNLVWARNFGNNGGDSINDMEVDTNGNIVLHIMFHDSLALSSTVTIESPSSSLTFSGGLFKLAPNSDILWAYATGISFAKDIAFDNNDNIYLAGYFLNKNDFDYGSGTFFMSETGFTYGWPLNYDAFIQKLSPDGNLVWAKQLSSPYNVIVHSIAVDSNENVYTTGVWQGCSVDIDFDPGPDVFSVTAPNTTRSKLFIHKLNASGGFEWVNTFGIWALTRNDIDPEQGGFVVTDSNDNLFFAGDLRNDIISPTSFDFGGKTYSPNHQDVFFAKLNTANGQPEWSSMINVSGDDNVYSANIDFENNLIVSGAFTENIDFASNGSGSSQLNSNGETDAFIAKIELDSSVVLSTDDFNPNSTSYQIYPNPCKDMIHIENSTGAKIESIELYDLKGRLLFKKSNKETDFKPINIDQLSQGTYILKIIAEKGKSYNTRILKM